MIYADSAYSSEYPRREHLLLRAAFSRLISQKTGMDSDILVI
jgi:hypothetical protein